jgi:hypothetical protein
MLPFIKRMFVESEPSPQSSPIGGCADEPAPDGNHEVLRSGKWNAAPAIPVMAYPQDLVLGEADNHLTPRGAKEVVLVSARLGRHRVELLLTDGDTAAVGLAVRIPSAANQFKEPYIVMESEQGNTREDAVREIDFHLRGRIPAPEVAAVDWKTVFGAAASKLNALRGH